MKPKYLKTKRGALVRVDGLLSMGPEVLQPSEMEILDETCFVRVAVYSHDGKMIYGKHDADELEAELMKEEAEDVEKATGD